MIDELYRLPENITEWNSETIRIINKIFEHIHQSSASIEYATTAPTKLDYGTLCMFDDGTEQAMYYKTGKGEMMSTIPRGGIIIWSGASTAVPTGWALCDGNNGTPNLQDKFIVGAGNTYSVADTGGAATVTLTTANIPAHTHNVTSYNNETSTTGPRPEGVTNTNAQGTSATSSVGGGGSHENLPPYYALCYIMKL